MEKTRRQHGFTLVELVIVIAIIGILAAIAIPNYLANLPTYRLRAAARDLAGRMQTARQLAVKNNGETRIVFNPTNNTYSLYSSGDDKAWGTADDIEVERTDLSSYGSGVRFGPGNATTDATTDHDAITLGGPVDTVNGDNITFNSNRVAFTPAGFADGNGYCYLQNQNKDSFAIGTLISGVIYLKKWRTSDWP